MSITPGGKRFRGDVRLNVGLPDGSQSGFLPAQNATSFVISVPEGETISRVSKMRDTAGQVFDETGDTPPHELQVTFDGFTGSLLATAFNGSEGGYDLAAKTGETVDVIAAIGGGVRVGAYNISNVTVTDATEQTTYEVDVDYQVESRLGLIRALPGGDIADGDALKVTYDSAKNDGTQIRGAVVSEITTEIVFDGIDMVSGQPVIIEFDKVVLRGSGDFDFLSDEFNTVEMTGTCQTLEGASEPYRMLFPNQ
ncbi:MAG TPA: hypothetical protein VFC95_03725 [Guyparkeria sp.]|nr:hypothetical protein [Guyparkeria sp.]